MTCFFGFSCQKVFWRGFPVVSGQEFLASGRFFLRVSPIPFLGLVWLFWVWCYPPLFFGPVSAFLGVVFLLFWFFPPVAIVCQDFLVSFSWFPIMVFLCTNTCVVHVPAAILSHEKPRVLSFLEEVVDLNKLSAVQFIPRGLIRLTFKELADKERLVSQGSIMLENVECDVTPSDRPYTIVYVHHFPAEGDDALLLEEFSRFGKIKASKRQHFAGRPNLLTGSRVLTMSLSKQIPAEVFVGSYPTRVWYRGMAPFCQICKSMSFPPLGAPLVSAEADVPLISETSS